MCHREAAMPVVSVYVQRRDDPEAAALEARLRRHGHSHLKSVEIERVYRLEYDPGFASLAQATRGGVSVDALRPLLANPVFETLSLESRLDSARGPVVEVGYRPAVTDPETPSILEGVRALGQGGIVWARLALRYQLAGVGEDEARRIAREALYNPVVQELI